MRWWWAAVIVLGTGSAVSGQDAKPKPGPRTFDEATKGLRRLPGYFNLYYDAAKDRVLLEIDRWDDEFLYVNSLATGVGSNEIGLDRGQLGATRIVYFERHGPKVFLVEPNYAYRAESTNPDERRAVREAFPQSVIWGFDVEAEGQGGRVVVDASRFFLRDARDVVAMLKRANQGAYALDANRSAFYLPRTKSFPRNTEVEVTLTFAGEQPGQLLATVAPNPKAITVRQHHSLIRLPEKGYKPREFDPRSGYIPISYFDYATPIGEPLRKQFIIRHRLEKKDPKAAVSDPVRPIVYYVDRGAPEPIRTALVEGARWWNQAYEAAGYRDAFRVELLPEDADPMDVRYNTIQWVHRDTRGWSYGSAVADPRTGEIIKGHVTMDSQRARQVFKIAESLLASDQGRPAPPEVEKVVLARIRQLSAHEVGHTIGLAHNFAASARGRASVMDYPPPVVSIREDGSLDLSQAYATGIGEWDKVAVAYGYQDFPPGTHEKEALDKILQKSIADGLVFVTDQDARPLGSAHPLAHLWDNGPNAVAELEHVLRVRARALARLSEKNLKPGKPMTLLEDQLLLVYLFHRFQAEAAAKVLGGIDFTYAVRGDGEKVADTVPAAEQHRALDALLGTLRPDVLALPERVLQIIPPHAYGYESGREVFTGRTSPGFDSLVAPETAAQMTVGLILEPARAGRLVEQHACDEKCPGLGAVIDRLISATWKAEPEPGYRGEIQRVVDGVVLYHLMALAANDKATEQARAVAYLKLDELKDWLGRRVKDTKDEGRRAHYLFADARIRAFERAPAKPTLPAPPPAPPGQPIGADDEGCATLGPASEGR